ncbi:YbgC/FadM family acyl-CoA thioesterase [Sphingomonas sabuli]|uniref:YbgC/FadM family acyl-CoA thioesterase n=1 Tax=Sphingomonas sabuli TaxID=2764186 RepID=A0A7G9L106_9SPHN|nr:YbgC/FadM family acyl-CoA thioesterase [Sphingomonas sabuli]QNM82305.1 YbgC/FadM family acyl-CoA thioesterase [Sphingomonas sabuli]
MTASSLDTPYRGGFIGADHHYALTVYFEDTDAAGIVYYANYLKFMERARSDMIRACGIDLAGELRATGRTYAVADVAIKYRKPAFLGDDLLVVSTVEQLRGVSVVIQQRVMRGGQVLTDAMVTAAFLSADQRPHRQPSEWVDRFRAIAKAGPDAS